MARAGGGGGGEGGGGGGGGQGLQPRGGPLGWQLGSLPVHHTPCYRQKMWMWGTHSSVLNLAGLALGVTQSVDHNYHQKWHLHRRLTLGCTANEESRSAFATAQHHHIKLTANWKLCRADNFKARHTSVPCNTGECDLQLCTNRWRARLADLVQIWSRQQNEGPHIFLSKSSSTQAGTPSLLSTTVCRHDASAVAGYLLKVLSPCHPLIFQIA